MSRISATLTENKWLASATLALALVSLQFAAIRLSPSDLLVRIALPSTIALVPLALWPLRRYVGAWVIFVGLAANLAVILANGGLMPIERATVESAIGPQRAAEYQLGDWIRGSKDVLVTRDTGRAVALGDSIIVRIGDGGFAASPGDVVAACGLLLLAAEAAWHWWNRTSRWSQSAGPRKAEGGASTPQSTRHPATIQEPRRSEGKNLPRAS